jgi:hypothetical protein
MQITVPITLVVEVSDEEARKGYLNDDGTVTLSFIADTFDILGDLEYDKIVSINNLTQDQLRQAFAAAESTL